MGRPERPIDPTSGPVAAFAAELRELRRTAGNPSYRLLSRRACFAPSVLSSAANGLTLPSLRVALAFVGACEGDPNIWAHRWYEAARAAHDSRLDGLDRPSGPSGSTPGARRHPIAPVPPVLAQLPPQVTTLVGRSTELAGLTRQLAARDPGDVAPILVHGPVGAGKTAFATHVAHHLRAHWPDGQLYADLNGSQERPRDPGAVLSRFIRSLGVPADLVPSDDEQRVALYRSLLADRRVLVLLDDAHDERQIRSLLAPTPGSLVLITARSRLAGLAAAHRVALGPLTPDESVTMLGALAGPERVEAERPLAHRIAELCDHLALPLWIVGARLATRPDWTLRWVMEKLRHAPERLMWLRVGDVSVQGRVAMAYRRLSPPARNLFQLLAGRLWTATGAGTLPTLDRLPVLDRLPAEADDLIDALTDQGLLQPHPGGIRLLGLFGLFASGVAGSEV